MARANSQTLVDKSIEFTKELGYVPQCPAESATVYSTHAFLRQAVDFRHALPIKRTLLGGTTALAILPDVIGYDCGTYEMLHRHTLFGFFARLFDPKVEAAFLDSPSTISPILYASSRNLASFDELRQCHQCAVDDVKAGKIAGWRLIHQLPFVSCCPWHGNLLRSRCSDCGTVYDRGSSFRLPSNTCWNCGRSTAKTGEIQGRPAEISLAKLCVRIFNGDAHELRPLNWADVVTFLVRLHGGAESAIDYLVALICSRWEYRSVYEKGLATSIKNEIELSVRPCDCFTRLLIREALDSSHPSVISAFTHEDGGADGLYAQEEAFGRELAKAAVAARLPLAVGNLIRNDFQTRSVAKACGVGAHVVSKFLNDLPHALQADLQEWACREVAEGRMRVRSHSPFWGSNRRRLFRRILQMVVQNNPEASRGEIKRAITGVYNWLRKNDRNRFEATVPSKHLMVSNFPSELGKIQRAIEMLAEAAEKNPAITRSELINLLPGVCKWLAKKCPLALDVFVPVLVKEHPAQVPVGIDLVRPSVRLPRRYRSDRQRIELGKAYLSSLGDLNPEISNRVLRSLAPSVVKRLRLAAPAWLDRYLLGRKKNTLLHAKRSN